METRYPDRQDAFESDCKRTQLRRWQRDKKSVADLVDDVQLVAEARRSSGGDNLSTFKQTLMEQTFCQKSLARPPRPMPFLSQTLS
jgi:hypothetical protein